MAFSRTTNSTLSPSAVPATTSTMSSTVLTVSGLTEFDGSSKFQYYGPLLRGLSSAFTISAWIKTTTLSVMVVISYGRNPSNVYGEFVLYVSDTGKLLLFDFNGVSGFDLVTGNSVVTTGQLTHIAFVKNGINGEFFVNGVSDGKVTASTSVTYSNTDFCIGKDYRDNNRYFNGILGEVRVFDTALTLPQVQGLASALSPTIAPTLMPLNSPESVHY
eukprot:gene14349-30541_t